MRTTRLIHGAQDQLSASCAETRPTGYAATVCSRLGGVCPAAGHRGRANARDAKPKERATLVEIVTRAEWWSYWTGVSAAVLTASAALAGLLAWYFSLQVAREDAARQRAMELQIAAQQERAANAELALAKLQSAMADRRLSIEQRKRLTEMLTGRAQPGYVVWIRSAPGDLEAQTLGLEIDAALREAGVHTEIRNDTAIAGPGIRIACGQNEGREFAVALADADYGCSPTVGAGFGPM